MKQIAVWKACLWFPLILQAGERRKGRKKGLFFHKWCRHFISKCMPALGRRLALDDVVLHRSQIGSAALISWVAFCTIISIHHWLLEDSSLAARVVIAIPCDNVSFLVLNALCLSLSVFVRTREVFGKEHTAQELNDEVISSVYISMYSNRKARSDSQINPLRSNSQINPF